ncbi:MAG: 16S rRNA (adenine(1518)-N(6)/adenine(1519)-N(6))-dimethyltransferase RsmA [Bryobacterales bacterium]|nr:16S rRNA (adenine(1518)-N(6)/adenine(1519)-N(6))-dimethyltransferase RsmA [Bryobacterales bacterium]
MPPRKARPPLGQHFLRDASVCARIADAIVSPPEAHVIEVGPGRGALTGHLAAKGVPLTVVEVDEALADGLRQKYEGQARVEVICADILDIDLPDLIVQRTTGRAVIAGNLPYYITSPIVRTVFSAAARIEQSVFLIQKEVALRLVARKDSRDYGFLSVLCRLHAEPELLFSVPPEAFQPSPEVTSAVVRLRIRRDIHAAPRFIDFLQRCFAHPRKKLLNNLCGIYPRETLRRSPETELRAQQLDLEELRTLWTTLEEASPPRIARSRLPPHGMIDR